MKKLEFYQLDVFTDKPFTGNPLAVFPHGQEVPDSAMQQIAAEMNLSETVFVLPSDKALRRLRIFTPKQELPLAGHPVLGTWNLLSRLGVVEPKENGVIRIEQELNLGVLPVDIEFRDNRVERVVMTQGDFKPGEIMDVESDIHNLASGLGIARDEIIDSEQLPIQVVSTGIKSIDVPLRSLNALEKCEVNSSLLSKIYLKYGAVGVFPFTFETKEADSSVHARFFAPADGIAEDPATGSAAGAFAGYALHHSAIENNSFVIEQGDFMNRPSRISANVTGTKGAVEKVQIGGKAVTVAKGEVFL